MKYLLIFLSVYLFPLALYAQPFAVGERKVNVSTVDDYCFVDPKSEFDKTLLDVYKKTLKHPNYLVSLLVPCVTLKQYRNHVSSYWKMYFTSAPKLEKIFATNAIKNSFDDNFYGQENIIPDVLCPAMSSNPKIGNINDLIDKNKEPEVLSKLKLGVGASFGVLESDKNSCYTLVLLKNLQEDDREEVQLTIFAPQILDGLAVMHNFTAPYEGYETIESSVKSLKSFVAAQ